MQIWQLYQVIMYIERTEDEKKKEERKNQFFRRYKSNKLPEL